MIKIARYGASTEGEYIGRPHALGNPFKIGPHGTRDEVIALYRTWFLGHMNDHEGADADRPMSVEQTAVYDLMLLAEAGDLTLICWCAPMACHGDVIKEWMDRNLAAHGSDGLLNRRTI